MRPQKISGNNWYRGGKNHFENETNPYFHFQIDLYTQNWLFQVFGYWCISGRMTVYVEPLFKTNPDMLLWRKIFKSVSCAIRLVRVGISPDISPRTSRMISSKPPRSSSTSESMSVEAEEDESDWSVPSSSRPLSFCSDSFISKILRFQMIFKKIYSAT